jgi:hypothetical protein
LEYVDIFPVAVLCGAAFHKNYILTAMAAAGSSTQQHPRPPPAHTSYNPRSAHMQKESRLELFQFHY